MCSHRTGLSLLVVATAACAAVEGGPIRETSHPPLAVSVEIIRDEFGVPHVYGPTDASVIFGEAWAEAEDNWWQVEDNFVRSIGRAAELYGPEAIRDDYVARAMEIERLSREEYDAASAEMRSLYDAYAAGFNAYLERHPDVEVRLLERVEPWYAIALLRFKYHHNEYIGYAGLTGRDIEALVETGGELPVGEGRAEPLSKRPDVSSETPATSGTAATSGAAATSLDAGASHAPTPVFESAMSLAGVEWPGGERPNGSNEWAVSGSRTASGHPMLLINPHVSFFGLSQYTEIHLESDEGLVFSGLSRFGFMFPYMGNSRRLGWAYTDNYADIGDLYFETIERREGGLHYRYGDEWRPATSWTESIVVRTETGLEARPYRFTKTHHGPVLGLRRRPGESTPTPLAARVAMLEEGRWYDQWYDMMRARDLAEWRAAVSRLAVPYQNTMYADVDGNIFYLYNSAVPRRSLDLDWSRPVDGSDPGAEWDGYHPVDELPQYLNPPTGYLQNTNSTPFMATEGLDDRRENYPPYMVGGETDNYRAVSSRRVLSALHGITLDDFARAVTDSRLSAADELLPRLFEEFDRLAGEASDDSVELSEAIDLLRAWDRVATVNSEATTLFVRWAQPYSRVRAGTGGERPATSLLRRTMDALASEWGTWRVAWGDVNRLQRPDASGQVPFSDQVSSLPVPAGPGWLGSVFTYTTRQAPGGIRQYGVHGNSFVKVIEFGPEIGARSILTFGQSGHPDSEHFFDQAPIYASKRFKPAWMSRADVEAHARRAYRVEVP